MKCSKDKGLFFQTLENGTQIQIKGDSKHLIEENTLVILDMSKKSQFKFFLFEIITKLCIKLKRKH
jgi:hypothetical protein